MHIDDGECHDHYPPRTSRSPPSISALPFFFHPPPPSSSQTPLTRRRRATSRVSSTTIRDGVQTLTMSQSPPSPSSNGAGQALSTFDPRTAYAPLLSCLACNPPGPLVFPTTLHCGHTVCAHHVRTPSNDHEDGNERTEHPPASSSTIQLPTSFSRILSSNPTQQHTLPPPPLPLQPPDPGQLPVMPTCPIPSCRQTFAAGSHLSTRINIPPNSTVAYYPPMQQQQLAHDLLQQRVTVPDPHIDVSVSRVLGLLERTGHWVAEDENDVVRVGGDEGNESGDESDENERADVLQDKTSPASCRRTGASRTIIAAPTQVSQPQRRRGPCQELFWALLSVRANGHDVNS